jgi:hypothetical protein
MYAKGTKVPVERSRGELETVLRRYGADAFTYGVDQEHAIPDRRRLQVEGPLLQRPFADTARPAARSAHPRAVARARARR